MEEEYKKTEETEQQEQNQAEDVTQERKQKIANAIAKIKEQDSIDEIHKKTRIALFKLEAIFACDYAQFDRTTAIGFIRILEREYHIDLSAWIADYDSYCQIHGLFKTDEYDATLLTDVNVKIDHYSKRASSKWLNIAIGIILVIFGGSYLIFNYLNMPLTQSEEVSQKVTENIKIKEENSSTQAREILQEDSKDVNATQNNTQENNQTLKQDSNATASTIKESNVTDSNKTAAPNNTAQPNATETNGQGVFFSVAENVTGRQLWLGILNVDTKKRSQQIVTGELFIQGGEPMLFVTGHGRFSVGVDKQNMQMLNGSSPLYLYYHPQEGVRVVDDAEFRVINGGKGW